MMKRWSGAALLAASLILGGLTGAAAQEGGAAAVRPQVEELLEAFEAAPSASEWTRLGPGAGEVLREIAADARRRPTVRSRAATALRHYPDAASFAALEVLARDEQTPVLVRRKAVRALAEGWGAQALGLVKPLVEHENLQLRESALRALAMIPTPEARALLEERLRLEPRAYLRETIQESIRKAPAVKAVEVKPTPEQPVIRVAPGAEGGAP